MIIIIRSDGHRERMAVDDTFIISQVYCLPSLSNLPRDIAKGNNFDLHSMRGKNLSPVREYSDSSIWRLKAL